MLKFLSIIACLLFVFVNAEDGPAAFDLNNHIAHELSYHNGVLCLLNKPQPSLDFSNQFPEMETLVFYNGNCHDKRLKEYYSQQDSDLGLSNNSNLRSIGIFQTNIDGVLLNSYLPQVTHLTFFGFEVANDPHVDFNFLRAMPNLKYFRWQIGAVPKHKDDWEKIISHGSSLEHIYLGIGLSKGITDEDIYSLSQLPNLKKLTIYLYCASPSYQEALKIKMQAALPTVNFVIDNYADVDFEGYWDY